MWSVLACNSPILILEDACFTKDPHRPCIDPRSVNQIRRGSYTTQNLCDKLGRVPARYETAYAACNRVNRMGCRSYE
jgi:hypothetical protein